MEGYLNASEPTVIKLSHTRSISKNDTASRLPELNAKVIVEDDRQNSYLLKETGNGIYTIDANFYNPDFKYRLHILTSSGKEYQSDFVPFKSSPPISNIDWNFKDNAVQLYANTEDPQNSTHFYRWNYEETWEYHTPYVSFWKFNKADNSLSPRTDQVHICWVSEKNTNILLGSSLKLQKDIIYHSPIVYFPEHDQRLNVLYSVLVTQFALDTSAYNYWTAMKSNTEDVGSIFDPQPNQTKGNIHCLTDPTEPVIGYIGAGSTTKFRAFIDNSSLPSTWNVRPDCESMFLTSDEQLLHFLIGWVPLYTGYENGVPGYYAAYKECGDCTYKGTNIKPAFWP